MMGLAAGEFPFWEFPFRDFPFREFPFREFHKECLLTSLAYLRR